MVLNGNFVSCDANGCQNQETFEGDLSPDDVRLRYHILGWHILGAEDQEFHFCPSHLICGSSSMTGLAVPGPMGCIKGR
jgi:hypothetical protein